VIIKEIVSWLSYTERKELNSMTLTLELSPEREAALKAQAQARGMSVEQWLLDLTEQFAPSTSIAHALASVCD
jgi:hypothetical protein